MRLGQAHRVAIAGGSLIRRFLLLIAVLGVAALATPAVAGAFADPARAPSVGDQAVHEVPLTDAAGPGFEQAVATDDATSVVGVKWNGSPDAEFTIEVQQDDGTWVAPYSVEGLDIGPDAGTDEARAVAERRGQDYITEPVAVDDPSQVRVRVDGGLAADVDFVTVGGEAGEPTAASDGTPAPTEAPATEPPATEPETSPSDVPADYPPTPSSSTPEATQASALTWSGVGLLAAAAAGWLILNRRRARRVGLLVIVAAGAVLVAACNPLPPGPPPPPETGIHSRAEWGGPNVGPCSGYTDPVTYGIVHHTGGGPADNNYTNAAAKINGIYNYHVTSGGYCDIAYNFLVDRDGGIWEGRAGGVTNAVMGAHTAGQNYNSFGVAVLGDFTYIDPGQAAKDAVIALFAWKFSIHGVNPVGKTNNEMWAHRNLNATACPGDLFFDDLSWMRTQLASYFGG